MPDFGSFAFRAIAATTGAIALIGSTPAKADVIDGNWCAHDGRAMSIVGPAIVTPGGQQARGRYTRHTFTYVVPPGEPGAGTTIEMVQLNQQTVRVEPEGAGGETWTRCDVIS